MWQRIVNDVAEGAPRSRRRLSARRRGHDLPGHKPVPLRRHRHRQPLRRHPDRPGRRRHRWHRPRRIREHQPRWRVPLDVRARSRFGARHRGTAEGRPHGRDPLHRAPARSPRAAGRGSACHPRCRGRHRGAGRGITAPPRRSATPSSRDCRRNLESRPLRGRTTRFGRDMTLIETDPDTGLAPLEFAVTKNLAAKNAAQRDEILVEPRLRHALHRPHGRHLLVGRAAAGTARACSPTGRSRSTRPPPCCTTARRSSRASRRTATQDGSIHTFRPDQNGRRLQRSARRLALPELPVSYFIQSLRELIAVDGAWVPSGEDQSLYLRPFMFAKEAFLGVRPAHKVDYYVIASPAGAYFKGGVQPVSIWLSEDYARAGKGGTGAAKTGGNYAAIAAAAVRGVRERVRPGGLPRPGPQRRRARRHERRVRLQGRHDRDPAVRRRSSRASRATRSCSSPMDRGHKVEGRAVSLDEWRSGVASGDIVEVFACGTAAVVTPIGVLKGKDFLDEQPIGDARAVAARGADRHPVRPHRRQARLAAAPRRLTRMPRPG